MGACLGRCFASVTHPSAFRHSSMYFQGDEHVVFSQFMDQDESIEPPKPHKIKTSLQTNSEARMIDITAVTDENDQLFLIQKRRGTSTSLELVEDGGWSRGSKKYTRLNTKSSAMSSTKLETPLQTLDARSLLRHQESSTPASSLDLEWEHEGMPLPVADNERAESTEDSITQPSCCNSQPSSLTASPWSRVSTPNSLEWDPVEADIVCVDVETEKLLTEIERLTDRALKETGEWSGAR